MGDDELYFYQNMMGKWKKKEGKQENNIDKKKKKKLKRNKTQK